MNGATAQAEADELGRRLDALQWWYEQNGTPLYAWEAIALCLNASPMLAIPYWCIPYLRDAATKITELAWSEGRAISAAKRRGEKRKNRSMGAPVLEALSLSSQGKKSAFARAAADAAAQRDALYVRRDGKTAAEDIARRRSVEPDRAARIIAKGKRLTGLA